MANPSQSQFIGTTGTYYVMARLAYERIHAACTFGNAPAVDILVSSADGERSISIQVKTADYARRTSGRGEQKQVARLDWPLKYKAVKKGYDNLFFVFVDLWGDEKKCIWSEAEKKLTHWQPSVYIIPSVDLVEKCKDWNANHWRFQPEIEFMKKYEDRWDLLKNALITPIALPDCE